MQLAVSPHSAPVLLIFPFDWRGEYLTRYYLSYTSMIYGPKKTLKRLLGWILDEETLRL